MKKLGVFVLTLFLLGCGKSWKEVEDYYAYYGIDIDESVEIIDNNGEEVNLKFLKLSLKTIHEDEGYWLDTGKIRIN